MPPDNRQRSYYCAGCETILEPGAVDALRGTHTVYFEPAFGAGIDTDEVGVVAEECGPVVVKGGRDHQGAGVMGDAADDARYFGERQAELREDHELGACEGYPRCGYCYSDVIAADANLARETNNVGEWCPHCGARKGNGGEG